MRVRNSNFAAPSDLDRVLQRIPDSGIYPHLEGLFLPQIEPDRQVQVPDEEPFKIVHLFGAWVLLFAGWAVSVVAGLKEIGVKYGAFTN